MNLRSRNHSIATGVAMFVVAVLVTVSANAQPDRHSRNRVTQPAAMLAQQTTATTCPNPTGSDSQARAAREATRNGRLDLAIDAWNAAIQMCPSPDLYEGLGRAHEGLAAVAVDDQHRLASLEAELSAFRQALALAEEHPVQGYSTDGLRARITALEPVIENLRQRLTTAVVVPPHPTAVTCTANTQTDVANCGACGHRCDAGLTCTAGTCRAVIATPPSVTTPNRTLPRVLWIGGAVATVTGVVLGTVGHLAAADRDTANARLAAPASQRCQTTNGQLQCLAYAPGATRPDSFTGLETPGWIITGVGAAAVIAGIVLELRASNHTMEGRPSPTVRPSLALGPDGTPMAGLGGTF